MWRGKGPIKQFFSETLVEDRTLYLVVNLYIRWSLTKCQRVYTYDIQRQNAITIAFNSIVNFLKRTIHSTTYGRVDT